MKEPLPFEQSKIDRFSSREVSLRLEMTRLMGGERHSVMMADELKVS